LPPSSWCMTGYCLTDILNIAHQYHTVPRPLPIFGIKMSICLAKKCHNVCGACCHVFLSSYQQRIAQFVCGIPVYVLEISIKLEIPHKPSDWRSVYFKQQSWVTREVQAFCSRHNVEYVKVVQPLALPTTLFNRILSTVTTILTFRDIWCDFLCHSHLFYNLLLVTAWKTKYCVEILLQNTKLREEGKQRKRSENERKVKEKPSRYRQHLLRF